ncbi:MAG: Rdx family protein [Planctomycetes bacterium]|nr:Rdx family protein [Planctomycetota bacterium]MBZ0153307.1 Rdx family protein [Planctomycetota bacterium]MCC7399739.1 Rdx family protein [Planctomycetota bacterium]
MKVSTQTGALGQFDVVVDGETIASRGGNVFQRILGGGWPDPEAVVRALEERLQARK